MSKERKNVMIICPGGSISSDELVAAARKVGALKEDREEVIVPQTFIKCPDGVTRTYAEFEDVIKPLWKEQMRKE